MQLVTDCYATFRHKVIPMFPTLHSAPITLGNSRFQFILGSSTKNRISCQRIGFPWLGVHCVTHYFSQGLNLNARKVLVDLRVAPTGAQADFAQAWMVMLSRHQSDDDRAPIAPLWAPGNLSDRAATIAKLRTLLSRSPDLHAELQRIHQIAVTTADGRPRKQNRHKRFKHCQVFCRPWLIHDSSEFYSTSLNSWKDYERMHDSCQSIL